MNSSQELEVLNWHLGGFDTELMVELAHCGSLYSSNRRLKLGTTLSWNTKWMRAACVRPHIWEGYLFGRSLLQKQFIFGVEEEDRECAV